MVTYEGGGCSLPPHWDTPELIYQRFCTSVTRPTLIIYIAFHNSSRKWINIVCPHLWSWGLGSFANHYVGNGYGGLNCILVIRRLQREIIFWNIMFLWRRKKVCCPHCSLAEKQREEETESWKEVYPEISRLKHLYVVTVTYESLCTPVYFHRYLELKYTPVRHPNLPLGRAKAEQ